MKRFLALVLCAVLLCGCGAKNAMGFSTVVKFRDMEYTRPDMEAVAAAAEKAMEADVKMKTTDQILEDVWEFYDRYDEFMTAYDLAYVHYHADQQDIYWQNEYEYCAAHAPELDLWLEDIYYALAESPHREALEEEYFGEGWFDDYQGDGYYDDALVALLEQEQLLIADYYDILSLSQELSEPEFYDAHAAELADLLAELTLLRRQIARDLGYDSYIELAWDWYYYRDYTPAQAEAYLEELKALVPLYESLGTTDLYAPGNEPCTEEEVYQYVRSAAENMGGTVWEAFRLMDQAELCDIRTSANKSGLSFELYFTEYAEPYILVSGTGTRYDCLTFAHEFGHFATDYAAAGSVAGIDVMEIFSQAMELLSLSSAAGGGALTELKLADSLCTYVEQAAYAAFEQALYRLPDSQLTGERLLELYAQTGTDYGFAAMDWDPRDLVTVPHFYGNPLYIISYVVSNDAAMQLYQLEQQTPGAGRDIFLRSLDTEQACFLAYLQEAGLQSPFGRVESVKAFFQERLGVS